MTDKLSPQERINRRMEEIFAADHKALSSVKELILQSGGKRIRPMLHFFFARLLGYEGDQWVDTGAIGEMIHSASLLHDDVIDESDRRRGKPSANALYGNKTAVLAGDYLLSCALSHIASLEHSHELLRIFTRTVRMLSVGELIQMQYENDITADPKTYDQVILGKTGSLFGAMTESAAVLAGITGEALAEYRLFGENLGRVFQIRDDYLDYFGTEDMLGKPPLQDYERGLVTRPVFLLRDALKSAARGEFLERWSDEGFRRSSDGKTYIINLMKQSGTDKAAEKETDDLLNGMHEFLKRYPDSSWKKDIAAQLEKLRIKG